MAASFNESQKIDYLWKKVGYGVTKTAESTSKEAFNESIASPLLYRGDLVWIQSGDIPSVPPASTTSLVQVYKDGGGVGYTATVECTEDLTAPDNQTWKTNLTNWVPTQFGDNYLVQVYVANAGILDPQTAGTKLFAAGSGNDDTWFFDYQSGILNFNGANIPSQITGGVAGKSIYIVGYRYVGLLGVTNLPSANIGNIQITGNTIATVNSNGNLVIDPNGTGQVIISSNLTVSGTVYGTFAGNISGNLTVPGANTQVIFNTDGTADAVAGLTFNKGSNLLAVTGNINSTNYFVGDGSFLTSVMADRGNDTNNWNALVQMGVYTVNRSSWSGVSGPPLDSLVYVGLLEVKTSTGNSNTTEQVFYPGTIDSADVKIQYNRSLWDGTWTSWVRMTSNGQVLDGGTF
jgi:hypothetical protein